MPTSTTFKREELSMSFESVVFDVLSIIGSGLFSFVIAKWVHARAQLKISLWRYTKVDAGALGKSISFKSGDLKLKNLCVLKLRIRSGAFRGITKNNLYGDKKPVLRIMGCKILDVKTVENNLTRFYIAISRKPKTDDMLMLNIEWLRHNTTAEFLLPVTLKDGVDLKKIKPELYPGLLHDVDVKVGGLISKRLNEVNFGDSSIQQTFETYSR